MIMIITMVWPGHDKTIFNQEMFCTSFCRSAVMSDYADLFCAVLFFGAELKVT